MRVIPVPTHRFAWAGLHGRAVLLALVLALAPAACSDGADPLAPEPPDAPTPLPDAAVLAGVLEDAEVRLLPDATAAVPVREALAGVRTQLLTPKPGGLEAALSGAAAALAAFADTEEAEPADVDAVRLALEAVERAR